MVISISVALDNSPKVSFFQTKTLEGRWKESFASAALRFGGMAATHQNSLSNQSYTFLKMPAIVARFKSVFRVL